DPADPPFARPPPVEEQGVAAVAEPRRELPGDDLRRPIARGAGAAHAAAASRSPVIFRVPHAGHAGSFRTRTVRNVMPNASTSSSRPMSGSPAPSSSLITSVAWIVPTRPGSTPNTPPSAQLGTRPSGGGERKRQR